MIVVTFAFSILSFVSPNEIRVQSHLILVPRAYGGRKERTCLQEPKEAKKNRGSTGKSARFKTRFEPRLSESEHLRIVFSIFTEVSVRTFTVRLTN